MAVAEYSGFPEAAFQLWFVFFFKPQPQKSVCWIVFGFIFQLHTTAAEPRVLIQLISALTSSI